MAPSSLDSIFSNLTSQVKTPLFRLNDKIERCALDLCAFLERAGPRNGEDRHGWIADFLLTGISDERELFSWIADRAEGGFSARAQDLCLKQADRWHSEGIAIAGWDSAFCGSLQPGESRSGSTERNLPCPSILFSRGNIDPRAPRIAVFNSRKPRLIDPDSPWIRALRDFPESRGTGDFILVSSTGTLTYDMAAVKAATVNRPLCLVLPFPLSEAGRECKAVFEDASESIPAFSCSIETKSCTRGQRLLCRDRIIAALSHAHFLLQIRSGGNLARILQNQQRSSPRMQFILDTGDETRSNGGNRALREEFPSHSRILSVSSPRPDEAAIEASPCPAGPSDCLHSAGDADPGRYLFHYTRGCPGPWPGESYREYLLKLLGGAPLSGHCAIDTLIRILLEGRIRAGSRMVRGQDRVSSWTSRPPSEIFALRKWNPALARWTVEPCGLALKRDLLRSMGAKPAVYGLDGDFARLPRTERYRFQICGTPHAEWRHEREWRFPGDFTLDSVGPKDCFIFVRNEIEKRKLLTYIRSSLPVLIFDARA
ncbi:MAG: hypothetical protein LLG06_06205 [Desulfobacteraceae bacterium]|nr:hypothetical protein [Desulfobacteraceae bacterium]